MAAIDIAGVRRDGRPPTSTVFSDESSDGATGARAFAVFTAVPEYPAMTERVIVVG